MPRARIAIPVPTSRDAAYNERSWPQYAAAVEAAGGDPVRVELASAARVLRDTARTCSGILLPGSPADVLPSRYGADEDPATNKADESRETTDWTLLEEAERHNIPVLGICYGMQSMNVYRGGSLVQDLLPLPVNHSAGRSVAAAHAVQVAPESLLASLLDPTEAPTEVPQENHLLSLPVNSSHHQAVAQPGTGLRIVARCPEDGVIEAIEIDYGTGSNANGTVAPWFFLAVQWHPERSTGISPASRNLFRRLVQEAEHKAGIAGA